MGRNKKFINKPAETSGRYKNNAGIGKVARGLSRIRNKEKGKGHRSLGAHSKIPKTKVFQYNPGRIGELIPIEYAEDKLIVNIKSLDITVMAYNEDDLLTQIEDWVELVGSNVELTTLEISEEGYLSLEGRILG